MIETMITMYPRFSNEEAQRRGAERKIVEAVGGREPAALDRPTKRPRTQRHFPKNWKSVLSPAQGFNSDADILLGHLDSPSPDFQTLLPPATIDLHRTSDLDSYMVPGADMAGGVPRIVSSAHINELVAKYSQPLADHDHWLPSVGFAPAPQGGFGFMAASLRDVKNSDVPSADCPARPAYHAFHGTAAGPREASDGEAGSRDREGEDAGVKSSLFEDLALMAANADIEGHRAEGFLPTDVSPVASEGGDPAVVEGLTLEDDTRQVVEKWLRDSPEAVFGLTDAPESSPTEEEEKSLPQWVLEELGETESVKDVPRVKRLVRAESNGSSTSFPSFSLRNDAWEVEDGQRSENLGLTEHKEMQTDRSFAQDGAKTSGVQYVDDTEVSTFSSPGEQILLQDDGDSAGAAACDNGMMHMSRSFSTAWMKDLLEDGDTFKGSLGDLGAAFPASVAAGCEDGCALVSGWGVDSLLH